MMIYKEGFTLVELSIVLVIIGLLIGGILVGQSLIESAKTQGYLRKMQQYEIAFDLFKDKYRQNSGDSNLIIPYGNKNDVIDTGVGACSGTYAGNEHFNAAAQLSAVGMIKEQISPYSPSSCGGSDPDSKDPVSYYSANEFMPGLGYKSAEWAASTGNGNSEPGIFFGAWGVFYPAPNENLFSVLDVTSSVSIDKKLDDGNTATGTYLSVLSSDGGTDCMSVLSTTPKADCLFEHRWRQ